MKSLLTLLFLVSAIQCALAQSADSTHLEFFPLHLGDEWQYFYGNYIGNPSYTKALKVVSANTALPGGKRYYQINDLKNNVPYIYYRIDSLFQVWESYGDSTETNYFRLNEQIGAMWHISQPRLLSEYIYPPYLFRFNGIDSNDVLGGTREYLSFSDIGHKSPSDSTLLPGYTYGLYRNIGIYEEPTGYFSYRTLLGAIINGVVYGSITRDEQSIQPMPRSYRLDQNYPNPFNGSTTIVYGLPQRSHVWLTIFDILGREIILLRDDEESEGDHDLHFNSSMLSSGVYYYRLRAYALEDKNIGYFLQTKKFILLK